MHHPPDLSLASSYIPACLCVLKSSVAFVLFIVSPVRGWIGLVCLLAVDRILWNQSGGILDVNAVECALIGGLMVAHTRGEGVHANVLQLGVVGLWGLLSALQITGMGRLSRAWEVLVAAGCVTLLSCLHQSPERVELSALRAFVFVVLNVVLPYLGVMMQHADIDTYVNACRTAPILLAEPEQAAAWLAIYVLCIGYQVRSIRPPEPQVIVHVQRPPPDDEVALLKEALKSRQL